jgi:hypothetical protein
MNNHSLSTSSLTHHSVQVLPTMPNFESGISMVYENSSPTLTVQRDCSSFSSEMTKIDGPATRALDQWILLSKRRWSTTPINATCGATDDESTDSVSSPGKKRLPCPTSTNSQQQQQQQQLQHKQTNSLLTDWNDLFNCLLVASDPRNDGMNIVNEPFPIIECDFDDMDTFDTE